MTAVLKRLAYDLDHTLLIKTAVSPMPDLHQIWQGKREFRDVIKEFEREFAAGRLVSGKRYDWPLRFRWAFSFEDAEAKLSALFTAAGLSFTVGGDTLQVN